MWLSLTGSLAGGGSSLFTLPPSSPTPEPSPSTSSEPSVSESPQPTPTPSETSASPSPAPTVTVTQTAQPVAAESMKLDADQFGVLLVSAVLVVMLLTAILFAQMRRP